MSRQYSNRPLIPSRRRLSHQMCDFVTYPASQTDDTPADGSSWPIIDPLSCAHQPPTSSEPSSILTQNNLPYFQYPSHEHTLESPLVLPNQEVINNNNNRIIHHSNESLPAYNFHYSQSNEREQTRPSLPLSLITAAATTATASAPHHRHYRLENPSAAAFTRHPPWFDDGSEDDSATIQRSTRNNNQTKRQRSSAASTPTSQSSQTYHHHERKRSRHEEINDDSARTNYTLQENVSQQPQSRSSDHHFQPYSNYRHVQPQPNPLPRTSYNDSVPSISRPFEPRPQTAQRNRIDHPYEINNSNVLYGPHLPHTVQPSLLAPSRTIYHSSVHRPLLLETPPVALPRRQPIPVPRSSYTQQQNHHQRTGITIESVPQRAPQFHRTSMPAHHLHQRHSNSFLTDLLHHVIDAHAASYSDNHVHYHHHHHHHPPTASIDLIAYAWMSPGHDIFSLPAAFSIQFGDFFDLTIPDETPVVGLTDSELERLPTMIFTKSCTTIQDDDKCAVCLSEYIGGEKLKHLRCKHFFHSECIDPWLKTSTRCPICRGEQTS
ncbi:unnamed protein product [Rotaria socialis]